MMRRPSFPLSLRPLNRLLAGLALASFTLPASAAVAEVKYSTHFDGTPNFDSTDGPGLDRGPRNDIVRTHDEFQYLVQLATDDAEKDLRIRLVMPQHAGKQVAVWSYLPTACKQGSTLSADKQTIDCRLGNVSSAGTLAVYFQGAVLGSSGNGDRITPPALEVSANGQVQAGPASLPETLTVSAAPFYDVVVQQSGSGPTGFQPESGPGGKDGFYHHMTIGLMARNPHGHGLKGVEQLDPSAPVEIDLDVKDYPPSVAVPNWHADLPASSGNRPTGSFADGCGSPNNGRPSSLFSGAIGMYYRVMDQGPTPSTANTYVANGGDCRTVASDRNHIRLALDGVDTTLKHIPTIMLPDRRKLPTQQEAWVANKALLVWTSIEDYPLNQPVYHTMKLNSVSGRSITGQEISGDQTDNNVSRTYPLTHEASGRASKQFQPDSSLPTPYATIRDPLMTSGNIVNQMSHGQTVSTQLTYSTYGTIPHQNVQMCDIVDRTAFDIGQHFKVTLNVNVPASEISYQYGVPASGSPYFTSTDSAHSEYEGQGNTPRSVIGTSEYARASCLDPTIRWYATPQEAEAAGGLVYVRALIRRLPASRDANMLISGLILRETWAATIEVQTPTHIIRQAGTPIAAGSIIRNRAELRSDTMPGLAKDPITWDHLRAVNRQTTTRPTKKVIAPANAATAPVPAGTVLTYQITAHYATVNKPVPGTITVTDVLPSGLKYVADSARFDGQQLEPTIQNDAPAKGLTTLTWKLENRTPFLGVHSAAAAQPPLTYQARTSQTLLDGTKLRNDVATSGGEYDAAADCTYVVGKGFGTCVKSAFAEVTVQTPPGFVLEKSSTQNSISPGDDFDYSISFASIGQDTLAPNLPDVIDILPFVGDGEDNPALSFGGRSPASSFDPGAYALKSVVPSSLDPNARIYYTKRPPHEIHNDPRDDSNRLVGGTTRWCLATELGTSGCPQAIGESTAIRVSPTLANLPRNTPYTIQLILGTHPVLAYPGNVFANRAGSRPVDPASSLLFVASQSNMQVRVRDHMSRLAGRVFADLDQNHVLDTADWALANRCITLQGTTSRGEAMTFSMRTDADGRYEFAEGARNKIHYNADCSGTPLPYFGGLLAGTYTVSKPAASGALSNGLAFLGTQAGSTTPNGTVQENRIAQITVARGAALQDYDFTEVPVRPRLTLVASVTNNHGATATADSVQLSATGADTAAGTIVQGNSGSSPVTQTTVPAGNYTLSAQELSDYNPASWQCVINGQAPVAGTNLTLAWGDQATCTASYEDQPKPAHLTLVSQVTNNHGGKASATDMTLSASHTDNGNTTTVSGTSGASTITRIEAANGTWTLASTALAGYTHGEWQCAIDGGAPASGNTLTLQRGQDAVCTINYEDQPPPPPQKKPTYLTLVSEIGNRHGGTKTTADLTLGASHTDDTGTTTALEGASGKPSITRVEVPTGAWTLSSAELGGYQRGEWSCTITPHADSTDKAVKQSSGNALSLAEGDEAVCTVRYEDVAPRLTLVGEVSNRHGGKASASDVTLQASQDHADGTSTTVSGISGSKAVTQVEVAHGDWTLSSSALNGYRHGDWQCAIDGGSARTGNSVALTHGQQAVCTIRYEDMPAQLTLVNIVTNQNGHTAKAEDFPLSAQGPTPLNGQSGSASVTGAGVLPGAYTLRADALPEYGSTPWSCNGGQLADSVLTIRSGEHVTCTIEHIDQPVSLTLDVDVVNEYGGTASKEDIALSATNVANPDDSISGISKTAAVTARQVKPGVFELQVPNLPRGYRVSKWVCTGGTLQDNILTLANREFAKCRVELKDIPASLKLAKAVDGTARLVAGTANEYDVAYTLTVSHEGGIAGVYDLVDAPAFDSDVEIVSATILRNDQALNVTPSAVTGAGTGAGAAQARRQWPLATQQSLAIGASDVYRMTFRVRVPFEGSTANDRCQAAGDGSGHGLFNAATLTRQQGGQASGEPLSAQACLDTPEPVLAATLSIDKTSTSRSVEMGDLITYQLRIRNNGKSPALSPMVVDRLPRGFRFEPGSVRIANARATQVQMQGDRELHITLDRVAAAGTAQAAGQGASNSDVTITYRLRAGVGSSQGDGINRAHVQCLGRDGASRSQCSNESRWKVRVTGGIFSDEACLAGQIYVDCNGNSVKDREELGIPGVRLYLENGTWIVSDEQGKYSHCGLRPRTHVLKVDERTLPRKSRLVTSSAQNVGDAHSLFIDAKKGMLHRADFIEGSCSATVIEQVKARQAQGANVSVQTEPEQPALKFESKYGAQARPRQQGTDGANQPMARTRH